MDEEEIKMEKEKMDLDNQIKEINDKKKQIQKKIKDKKLLNRQKKESYSNGGNKLIRVSQNFCTRLNNIDNKREEFGFDKLSHPKKTELIIRHNNWKNQEEDIIHFNTKVENKEEGNDKK